MKAKIVYMALALVLVFSLSVAIVPASPVMAEESEITIDLVTQYATGSHWSVYQEFESHASVSSECGVSSGTVDMTDLVIVMQFASSTQPDLLIGGFVRGDWSATLDGEEYSGTVTGYVGPVSETQAEVWGIFYDDIGPNDIEGRFNMLLDPVSMAVDVYTIEITWKDGRQCYCPLVVDVVHAQIDPISEATSGTAFWGGYTFTGTGSSTGYYNCPLITVTAGLCDRITGGPGPFALYHGAVYDEGYTVFDYTCDQGGGGQAKGYNKYMVPMPKDLKFEGAIEASARGLEVWQNSITATLRHCAGGPCIPEEPTPEEGCFIATAAYGTSTTEEIDVLRAFRDEVLLESTLGSQLVAFYYEVSPPVADFISEHDVLRTLVRELLVDPVVWVVDAIGTLWRD